MAKINRRDVLKLLGLAGVTAATHTGSFAQAPEGLTVTILHTNDTHDHLEPTTLGPVGGQVQYGGVARVKTVLDGLKRTSINPIILDAGDVFTGTIFGVVYKGLADLAYIEAWDVQAQTIGNHEFDHGPQDLAEYLKAASFPVVCANIDVSNEPLLKGRIPPSTVIEVQNGRVGVVGLATPTTPSLSNPGPNIRFLDPLETAQREIDALRARGIRAIVVLSHLGYEEDLALAAQLRGAGVIVGGHSHTPLGSYEGAMLPRSRGEYPTRVNGADGKPVLITQAWEWAKFVGTLQVSFDAQGTVRQWSGKVIPVTSAYAEDPRLAATVRAFQVPVDGYRRQVVTQSRVKLDRSMQNGESNLGNLITDAFLWKTRSAGTTIALQNAGGIRASAEAGPLTVGQIIEIQPFQNTLILIELSGLELKAALDHGAGQFGKGGFPQVAGLRLVLAPKRPASERVLEIEVQDPQGHYLPLDLKKTYTLVTNSFLANGGDGYVMLRDLKKRDTYFVDNQVVVEYCSTLTSIEPKLEGRIQLR